MTAMYRDLAAEAYPVYAGDVVSATTGGTGDATAAPGAAIDLTALPDRFESVAFVISAKTTLAANKALSISAKIETSADNIGRILRSGATLPRRVTRDTGSQSRAYTLYASRAGVFASRRDIGDAVCCGEAIARIGRQTITAPLSGRLRGLARPGLPIAVGAEIAEIVPPDVDEKLVGIGDRARRVADSVLTLVRELRA